MWKKEEKCWKIFSSDRNCLLKLVEYFAHKLFVIFIFRETFLENFENNADNCCFCMTRIPFFLEFLSFNRRTYNTSVGFYEFKKKKISDNLEYFSILVVVDSLDKDLRTRFLIPTLGMYSTWVLSHVLTNKKNHLVSVGYIDLFKSKIGIMLRSLVYKLPVSHFFELASIETWNILLRETFFFLFFVCRVMKNIKHLVKQILDTITIELVLSRESR